MGKVKCYICGDNSKRRMQCPGCGKVFCSHHAPPGWISGVGKCPNCGAEIRGRNKVS